MSTSTEGARPVGVATDLLAWQGVKASSVTAGVRPLFAIDPAEADGHRQAHKFVMPSAVDHVATAEGVAYARGFSDGEAAGREAERAPVELMLARMMATIDQIAGLRTGILQRSERDIARLSVAIAERVVRRQVQTDRAVLLDMARAATLRLRAETVATILLNPGDLAATSSERATARGDGPIRVLADANVAPGGCLVETSLGTIDVGLDAQIREVLRSFLGEDSAAPIAADETDDAGDEY